MCASLLFPVCPVCIHLCVISNQSTKKKSCHLCQTFQKLDSFLQKTRSKVLSSYQDLARLGNHIFSQDKNCALCNQCNHNIKVKLVKGLGYVTNFEVCNSVLHHNGFMVSVSYIIMVLWILHLILVRPGVPVVIAPVASIY